MSAMAADPSPTEVPPWLKTLPVAPEYHPTLAEFQDPIAYILKIEKEASQYGICKIVPPLPPPPKKTTVANLNRSFAARSLGDGNKAPTFTTRQQQIGFCPRRPRPLQRPVWQSGERYTLQEFEAKAKQFERTQLRKAGKKCFSPLEVESLFWKACADKPFSVEYANDMPGSGFVPLGKGKKRREEEAGNVGDTAWNMRGVSRAKGSLLRFMKEEIPGVTSPMVYVAMMFSWFAWHVEDHDLHSLNYLHMGAGKTWLGVPRDARLAFEEVVREHGYGGEVNHLVTFATLGEKTTVMSPEVLISAGIPCCRLVQNAGEFVVTFPGAYHSGFSHGFNCGEASNIATAGWLKVAKEAAIRRASINHPPMVSHYQLLYALALSLCSRMPMIASIEPRSSRLKDKMRGEGETMVKEIFVQNVIENNSLLGILLDEGSSCIVIPQDTFNSPSFSSAFTGSQVKMKPRLPFGPYSHREAMEPSSILPSNDAIPDRNEEIRPAIGLCSIKGKSLLLSQGRKFSSTSCSEVGTDSFCFSTSDLQDSNIENESKLHHDGLLDQGLLSCVTCGILSFSCMAIVQPTEATARYLMSADCSSFNDPIIGSGEISDVDNSNWKTSKFNLVNGSVQKEKNVQNKCSTHSDQVPDQSFECKSETMASKGISALDLLASAYGDPSDSEEEALDKMPVCENENDLGDSLSTCNANSESRPAIASQNCHLSDFPKGETRLPLSKADHQNTSGVNDALHFNALATVGTVRTYQSKMELARENQKKGQEALLPGCVGNGAKIATSSSLLKPKADPQHSDCGELGGSCDTTGTAIISQSDMKKGNPRSDLADFSMLTNSCSATPTGDAALTAHLCNYNTRVKDCTTSAVLNVDKDSSRMHVFCLEHAVSVKRQLHPLGGVHIMLLCHPDYPKIEAEAQFLAEELGINHHWNDIHFQKATEEDQERIQTALEDEEAIPLNSDWAVKMGINLYYSANQSKSPLYSKQMPYNAIIYKAFGHDSPGSSPVKSGGTGRRLGRQKKIVVAGRWCGKVWMSNQVHSYLSHINEVEEQEHEDRHRCIDTNQNARVETDTEHAIKALLWERNLSDDSTPVTRQSGRKRKRTSRKVVGKKPRCTPLDSSDNVDEVPTVSLPQGGRVLRSSLVKHPARANRTEITTWRKLNLKDKVEESPSSRLRKRLPKSEEVKIKPCEKKIRSRKAKKVQKAQAKDLNIRDEEAEYPCDVEGCSMSFGTKQDLALHKRNICPVKGCGKKFFSHKYLVQHRKVHMDDRPLKCPWKGCKMTFKWPWARTEHIRVHTGARPYVCREAGCGQTFRFVSDFSRHKRKTGHLAKKACR